MSSATEYRPSAEMAAISGRPSALFVALWLVGSVASASLSAAIGYAIGQLL